MIGDLLWALRWLRKNPLFTAAVTAILAKHGQAILIQKPEKPIAKYACLGADARGRTGRVGG
jgi:hypothetical protein